MTHSPYFPAQETEEWIDQDIVDELDRSDLNWRSFIRDHARQMWEQGIMDYDDWDVVFGEAVFQANETAFENDIDTKFEVDGQTADLLVTSYNNDTYRETLVEEDAININNWNVVALDHLGCAENKRDFKNRIRNLFVAMISTFYEELEDRQTEAEQELL